MAAPSFPCYPVTATNCCRVIGDFCEDFGVPRQMKAALIKKAKFTGGKLGMLS